MFGDIYDTHDLVITAQKEPWSFGDIELAGYTRRNNRISLVQPLIAEEQEEGAALLPFTRLGAAAAQHLMDALWDCGLRPSEGSGSAGSLRKTEEHLADMRRIAFKQLGIAEK